MDPEESDQTLAKLTLALSELYPDYSKKIQALRIGKLIINAPKSIVNLFESKELQEETDKAVLFKGWNAVLDLVIYLFEQFPLNAAFVFEAARFLVDSPVARGKPVDIVVYICLNIFKFLSKEYMSLPIVNKFVSMYELIVLNSFIKSSSLSCITQMLADLHYKGQLTQMQLKISHELLGKASSSNRLKSKEYKGNLQPYLYFNGSAKVGFKLLLTNNKWNFTKGMHLCVWFKFLGNKNNSRNSGVEDSNSTILQIKTDDKNEIRVKQEMREIGVESVVAGEINKRKVCDLPVGSIVKLEVILEAKESGLFKSNDYSLSIGVNGTFQNKIEVKMPKITSSDYISEFNMFKEFPGQFYSLIINRIDKERTPMPPRITSEQELADFMKQPGTSDNIVTIISPMRVHKGILINHFNSQENHACHEASAVMEKVHERIEPTQQPEVALPLLYLTSNLLMESAHSQNGVINISRKLEEAVFNTILQEYVIGNYVMDEVRGSEKSLKAVVEETYKNLKPFNNPTLKNYQLAILYILYFIELTGYPLTSKTLNLIIKASKNNFPHWHLFIKYCDSDLLQEKTAMGLDKTALLPDQQDQVFNPVSKLQLLFLLETQWKNYWNRLQYSTQWWEPLLIKMQNNQPFCHQDYIYHQPEQADQESGSQSQIGLEWSVSDFITNDFCDCLTIPVIGFKSELKIEGVSSNSFTKYRDEFNKKQCMSEEFSEALLSSSFLGDSNSTPDKITFKKVVASTMSKLKQKFGRKENPEANLQKTTMLPSKEYGPQKMVFSTDACYINLLTLVVGTIKINTSSIEFYGKHDTKAFDHMCVKAFRNEEFIYHCFAFADIKVVKRRRFNQSMNGLEIRLKSGYGYLFYFHEKNVEKFLAVLNDLAKNNFVTVVKDPYDEYLKSNHTIMWIDKQISNWEYLQWLNDIAGRSYSDITQYPVLPWVFVSDEPEAVISKESSYRNLEKNMGSFGPEERIRHFLDKFTSVGEGEIFSDYHFGTHYSSSAIIFNYLIRLRPFSIGAMTLQSGKFDCADRVFSNYIGSWNNATNSPTDLRELIPEVYLLPEMMININNYDFGLTQLKERICNVEIPKWANHNPYIFCKNLRKSLESTYVTAKINHWIDLIYGYKQQGKAAVDSMNIFFPLTYEMAVNLDKISDAEERMSFQTQIAHFGQNPAQIIGSSPHPVRSEIKQKWESRLLADGNQLVIQRCNLSRQQTPHEKFIFQSVFEDKNSIISIKFISEDIFLVLRRYQFCIFKILNEKSGFISKEREIEYVIEKENVSLDYGNIQTIVPMVIIHSGAIALAAGFYNGNVQVIFLNEVKYSSNLSFPFSTICALSYHEEYSYLYVGDSEGKLGVYAVAISPGGKEIQFEEKFLDQVHLGKINDISINRQANLFVTASEDSSLKIFNLYSQELYRKISTKYPVIFARISTCPLYSVIFYTEQDSKIHSYSINGQFLAELEEPTGFVYNMGVLPKSDHTECLVYLNAHRELYIHELPDLKMRKKLRLKKDQFKISCFEMSRRIALAGSQDGTLQIIADPNSY